MWSLLHLAALLAAALSITAATRGPFSATLTTEHVQEMGKEVKCDVVITNNHDTDYYLLTRNTPLDDLTTHIFTIKKGAHLTVYYDGFLFKRGYPTEDEYVRVPGKSSISSTVVLSKTYSFDRPSIYTVRLNTHVLYSKSLSVTPQSQHLLSNKAFFFFARTGKQPILTEPEYLRQRDEDTSGQGPNLNSRGYVDPGFYNDWPPEEEMITQTAYSKAFETVSKIGAAVDSNPSTYMEWFGAASDKRKSKVKSMFNSVATAMATDAYKLYYYGHTCKDDLYGYTWYKSKNIVLCKKYFTASNSGFSSKMGTLIHQLTHSAAHTKDIAGADGTTGALKLALTDPDKATRNADNYEYFAESI